MKNSNKFIITLISALIGFIVIVSAFKMISGAIGLLHSAIYAFLGIIIIIALIIIVIWMLTYSKKNNK